MPSSPDRTQIEEVMAGVDVSGIEDRGERNGKRRAAVIAFLDDDETYNLDAAGPAQQNPIRDMILNDLPSYPSWEKS